MTAEETKLIVEDVLTLQTEIYTRVIAEHPGASHPVGISFDVASRIVAARIVAGAGITIVNNAG